MCGLGAEQGAGVQGGSVAGVGRVAGFGRVGAGWLNHFLLNSQGVGIHGIPCQSTSSWVVVRTHGEGFREVLAALLAAVPEQHRHQVRSICTDSPSVLMGIRNGFQFGGSFCGRSISMMEGGWGVEGRRRGGGLRLGP